MMAERTETAVGATNGTVDRVNEGGGGNVAQSGRGAAEAARPRTPRELAADRDAAITYEPPTLEGRVMADLGRQLTAARAEVSELQHILEETWRRDRAALDQQIARADTAAAALATALAMNARLRQALREIANEDYRGNRSPASSLAWAVLNAKEGA